MIHVIVVIEVCRIAAGSRRTQCGARHAGAEHGQVVLIHVAGAERVRHRLRERGYAVRRGDTFPGLGVDWLRIAVRDTATTDAFVSVLSTTLED